VPNAIVRSKGDRATYFGHELERCRDYASLHYRLPFEKVNLHELVFVGNLTSFKGFLVDWDAQKAVWDGIFSPEVLDVRLSLTGLRHRSLSESD
jgi:actin-related protein 6